MPDSMIEYVLVRGEPLKHATQHAANLIERMLDASSGVQIDIIQSRSLLRTIADELRKQKIPTLDMLSQFGELNVKWSESLTTLASTLHLIEGALFALIAVNGYSTNGRDSAKPSTN